MKYKIGFAGIHIESSTFTPYISDEKDFISLRGDELLKKRYSFLSEYDDSIEAIGLIHKRALPGGIVKREMFDSWLDEFIKGLKSQRLDGLFFDIHGAMTIEGIIDGEGYISSKIRKTIGDDVIISSPMDSHGNVSDQLFNNIDIITAYRTAPHIDVLETRKRALDNLIYLLDNKNKKLSSIKVKVPILLAGEQTSTEVDPGKYIYGKIKDYLDSKEILDLSILMGFPWADEARNHLSILVYGEDINECQRVSKSLSRLIYDRHKDFDFVGPAYDKDKSIELAFNSDLRPFFISDTGDNPGAGGRGDLVILLKEIISYVRINKRPEKILFASIYDNRAIEKIYERKKGLVDLYLGNILDNKYGDPINDSFEIVNLFFDQVGKRSALIKKKDIYIIVNENRCQYGSIEMYKKAGIKKLEDFDIVVVKMGYLEPDLSKTKKGWVMALTQGAVSQKLSSLEYKNLSRPIYPLDKIEYSNIEYSIKKTKEK